MPDSQSAESGFGADRKNNALTLIFAAAMLAWRASQHVPMRSASTL
jgi:hypothetical protein